MLQKIIVIIWNQCLVCFALYLTSLEWEVVGLASNFCFTVQEAALSTTDKDCMVSRLESDTRVRVGIHIYLPVHCDLVTLHVKKAGYLLQSSIHILKYSRPDVYASNTCHWTVTIACFLINQSELDSKVIMPTEIRVNIITFH